MINNLAHKSSYRIGEKILYNPRSWKMGTKEIFEINIIYWEGSIVFLATRIKEDLIFLLRIFQIIFFSYYIVSLWSWEERLLSFLFVLHEKFFF